MRTSCRGHNAKVRSLAWSVDDSSLVSAGADGAVYEWRLKDLRREKENVIKVSPLVAL
jgi:WD40 repeat protein